MRYLRIAALSIALLFVFPQADAQQAPWTWTSITANSGSVILPYANTPTFNGVAIANGDWIGGFGTNNQFCVGAVLWEVNQPPQLANGLTVWGDDDQTTVVDGLVAGEIIQYRLWRQATGLEYIANAVTYATGSSNTTGAYLTNGIWVISSMTFVGGYSISGTITYANTANTPMTNTNVALVSGELVIATTTTDATGSYTFEGVADGSYKLVATTTKARGGFNVGDVSVTRQRLANMITFTAIQTKAGDVNQSNTLNVADVTIMRQKLANMNPTNWLIPDYVFENPTVQVNGANVSSNFKSLCAGDVNGSFTPAL